MKRAVDRTRRGWQAARVLGLVPPCVISLALVQPILTAPADGSTTLGRSQSNRAEGGKRWRRRADEKPTFRIAAEPRGGSAGSRVSVVVRLAGGRGTARHAAFHVWADPALLKYVGSTPTGRGVVILTPSTRPGEVVAYRSSLPEGFADVEKLVELQYKRLAPGAFSVMLTDVRLLDGGARDLEAGCEGGSLVIE